jgi:hypothetical protein
VGLALQMSNHSFSAWLQILCAITAQHFRYYNSLPEETTQDLVYPSERI